MTDALVVHLDIIIHATEDADKIFESIHQTLGINPEIFDTTQTKGHYRNPIMVATATLRKTDATRFIGILSDRLGIYQRDEIMQTISTRISDSSLYLRLDRQEIVRNGSVMLQDSGTIRIKIHIPIHNRRAEDAFTDILHGSSHKVV